MVINYRIRFLIEAFYGIRRIRKIDQRKWITLKRHMLILSFLVNNDFIKWESNDILSRDYLCNCVSILLLFLRALLRESLDLFVKPFIRIYSKWRSDGAPCDEIPLLQLYTFAIRRSMIPTGMIVWKCICRCDEKIVEMVVRGTCKRCQIWLLLGKAINNWAHFFSYGKVSNDP